MSSRSLGSLTIDLIAKIAGFEQGMDKAARIADKRMREIERRAKIAGAAIGTAFVVGAGIVANQLRNTINSMDELSKAAQRANLPTEEFSKLAYAGDLADVAIQDLQSSMGRLAKAQADAQKATSQQARIFDALGIATKDAEGNLRNTYDVFLDFADAFKRNQGSPEIMAAGLNLFGRSFQNLVPLIKDGSEGLRDAGAEAERLGLVLSTEAGQAAEAFNDNLTRVGAALRGMWTQIASRSLPQLEELSAAFARTAEEAHLAAAGAEAVKLAARTGTAIMEAYANAVARTSIAIETLANASAGFVEIMRNVGIGGLFNEGSVRDGMRKVSAAFEQGQRDLDRLIERQNSPFRNVVSGASTVPAGGGRGPDRGLAGMFADAPKGGGGKSEAERQAERLQNAYDGLMSRMHETIELFGKEGEAAKVRYEIEHGALKGLSEPLAQLAIQRAEQIDSMRELAELQKAADEAVKAQTKEYQDEKQRVDEFVKSLKDEVMWLAATTDQRYRLEAAQIAGKHATAEETAEIEKQLRLRDQMFEVNRNWEELNRNISDSLFDVVTSAESASDAIKGFFDRLNEQILRNITDDWADSITDALKGFAQSGSSGSGGFWANLLSAFGFGGGRASGGHVGPNRMYEVNEAGMEMLTVRGRDYLLTGNNSGNITPAHQVGNGRALSVTQQFINPVLADRRSDTQRAADSARKLRQAQRYA